MVYTCPLPLEPPSRSFMLSQSTGFGVLASYNEFPLATCFTYGNVYISMLFSQSNHKFPYNRKAVDTGDRLPFVSLVAQSCLIALQVPLSMGFPRQEYWSGVPFPSLGESSQPRDMTRISCISRDIFTNELPGKPPV